MVDWEGLKARWRLGSPIILPSEFSTILAAHERDQRVIGAAEKVVRIAIKHAHFSDLQEAIAEFDKAKL